MLEPLITEKPAFEIVGFEAPFIHALSPDRTNFKVIPELWDQLFRRMSDIPNRAGQESYGVIYGLPEEERSHPHELQYIAGVRVNAATEVPDGMSARTVDSGAFAVFVHRGPIDLIGETVHEIYRVWLPQSDYEHAGIVDVELYDERFNCEGDDSEMEYWISVKPKTPDG